MDLWSESWNGGGAAEPGRPAGRIVLVHGFTQTGRSWRHIVEGLLAEPGGPLEIVTVDAPGHGRSATVTADLPTGAALLGRAGGAATYVGYSMGARLCLTLALARPDLVGRLVLLGGTAGIDDDAEREARRQSDEALAQRLEADGLDAFLDAWLELPLFAGLPHDPVARAERLTNTVAGLAASLRLAGTGTMDPPLWDRLGELAMPVLVTAGERDAKFTDIARRMGRAIGPNAAVALVPDAGHAAHLERPEAFVELLRAWLAETPFWRT